MTSHRHVSAALMAFSMVFASLTAWSAQHADPANGTWKVNPAKSTYIPGPPPKDGGITKIEITGDSITMISDGINAQGEVTHVKYVAKFDGKDYPVTSEINGHPNPNGLDGVALTRIDDYSFEGVYKLKGQPYAKNRTVISKDGKTKTYTVTGKTPKGQTISITSVSDRQ